VPYNISIEVTVEAARLDLAALSLLAERVMTGEEVAQATALAVLITDDDEVREMNRDFLGIDEPTDVLSFPDEADDFVVGMADEKLLGDIAVALPTAQRQADEAGLSLDAEVGHLLVHGILHLCGYDHVDSPADEARMREREEHYLGPDVHHGRPHD
jgi:probable rRNA maturation factor